MSFPGICKRPAICRQLSLMVVAMSETTLTAMSLSIPKYGAASISWSMSSSFPWISEMAVLSVVPRSGTGLTSNAGDSLQRPPPP
ncbi:hypothetical protein D3C87_1742350 [compost metagenome]